MTLPPVTTRAPEAAPSPPQVQLPVLHEFQPGPPNNVFQYHYMGVDRLEYPVHHNATLAVPDGKDSKQAVSPSLER